LQAAPQAVHGPRGDNVEASARGVLAKLVEGWAAVSALGTTLARILVDLGNLPSSVLARLDKVASLQGGALPVGGYAEVEGNASGFGGSYGGSLGAASVERKVSVELFQ
jgi:hypothetical protein